MALVSYSAMRRDIPGKSPYITLKHKVNFPDIFCSVQGLRETDQRCMRSLLVLHKFKVVFLRIRITMCHTNVQICRLIALAYGNQN